MSINYKIDSKALHAEMMSLDSNEGPCIGWGRFIKTPNQNLIDFFNKYLTIEHKNILDLGSFFAVGAYFDQTDYYLEYAQTPTQLAKCFDDIIKQAINNTGMYENFGNKFE